MSQMQRGNHPLEDLKLYVGSGSEIIIKRNTFESKTISKFYIRSGCLKTE